MRGIFQHTSTLATFAIAAAVMGQATHAFAQESSIKLPEQKQATDAPADVKTVKPGTTDTPAHPTAIDDTKPPLIEEPNGTLHAAKPLQNYKYEDTSGITDLRLRAEQGSMSRFSGKFSFGYNGPVIDDLNNPYQPDPDNSVTHNPTSLKGDIALRYRMSPTSAMNFGTGVSRVTPFTDEARTDVNTPFIAYDHTHRVKAYQLRESVRTSLVTNPEMRATGQVASLGLGFAVLRNINYSRWEVGFDTNFDYSFYSRPYDPGAPATVSQSNVQGGRPRRRGITSFVRNGDGNAGQFSVGISPTVRYRISEKVGAYTGVGFRFMDPRSAGNAQLDEKTVGGRAGVDIGFNHSFYFSPFIGFQPGAMALDTTSINFSTIFSLF